MPESNAPRPNERWQTGGARIKKEKKIKQKNLSLALMPFQATD